MNQEISFRMTAVAERYAAALIDLGEKSNLLDAFDHDLGVIISTLEENDDLYKFLTPPMVTLGDKKEVLDAIFKNSVSSYILNTLKLILDRNRIHALPAIVAQYHAILNKKRNIQVAEIITAIPIDSDILSRVKSQLEKILNASIEIKSRIDQDIIAGMVVKVGDRVIDGSIRTKLENIKKQVV